MVARRHVFYLAGFDPIDAGAQHRRFRRESEKFSRVWNANVSVSDLETTPVGSGSWHVTASGPNWTTGSTVELLDWQDIVRAELKRPAIAHIAGGIVAFADFIWTGTAKRYFEAAWPYGVFFVTPFFHIVANAAISATAGIVAARYVDANAAVSLAVFCVVACALFAVLFRWPGDRWHVRRALADWVFARAFMYGRRRALDDRLDSFADRVVARARAGGCEEILVVGHSLGATMAVLTLSRAIARDAEVFQHGPKVCLLTVGSTIGKLALHPAAGHMRDSAVQLAAAEGLAWTEYQARRDSISFFRFNPVTLVRFKGDMSGERPLIRLTGIKDMMRHDSYRRNWFRHMRLHYQFVMGNEKRAGYDFFMFVCGPAGFAQLSRTTRGPDDLFGPDGAYLPSEGQAASPSAAGVAR